MASASPVRTRPDLGDWPESLGAGYRRSERSATIPARGEEWERLCADLLRWKVKTRSGFSVSPDRPVAVGDRPVITVRMPGLTIHEPVEVVSVVMEPDRVGFAYRTLPGHPVEGEEAFILHRSSDRMRLTVRSLTRPARSPGWMLLYPLLRVAQAVVRRRYLRAMR